MKNGERYLSSARRCLACAALLATTAANGATLGGPLTLEDEGSFFVNGQVVKSDYPGPSLVTGPAAPGSITINQI